MIVGGWRRAIGTLLVLARLILAWLVLALLAAIAPWPLSRT
jgi:hypothetical protein